MLYVYFSNIVDCMADIISLQDFVLTIIVENLFRFWSKTRRHQYK